MNILLLHLQRLMSLGGDDIGVPTPVAVNVAPAEVNVTTLVGVNGVVS